MGSCWQCGVSKDSHRAGSCLLVQGGVEGKRLVLRDRDSVVRFLED